LILEVMAAPPRLLTKIPETSSSRLGTNLRGPGDTPLGFLERSITPTIALHLAGFFGMSAVFSFAPLADSKARP
jgi:hypothetical protein